MPITGQKVVVEYVGEDPAESAVGGAEEEDAAANDGVGVGEGIDLAMTPNAVLKFLRQVLQFGGGKDIGQQVANAEGGSRI